VGGAGGADVDVEGVVGVALSELLLDPQPLIADTKKINASGANAVNVLDLYTIATCSYLSVNHADCEQLSVSSQRRHSSHPRKPRYLQLTDRKLCVTGLRRVCP
jgi:hypothetical protein